MIDHVRSIFINGLRNGHAMENRALSVMKPRIPGIENYSAVVARLEEQRLESEPRIEHIEGNLAKLDQSPCTALSADCSVATHDHSLAIKSSKDNLKAITLKYASRSEMGETAQVEGRRRQ